MNDELHNRGLVLVGAILLILLLVYLWPMLEAFAAAFRAAYYLGGFCA